MSKESQRKVLDSIPVEICESEESIRIEREWAQQFKELSGYDWPPKNAAEWTIVLTRAGFSQQRIEQFLAHRGTPGFEDCGELPRGYYTSNRDEWPTFSAALMTGLERWRIQEGDMAKRETNEVAPANPSMKCRDELRKIATALDSAKQEINLARQQSGKPEHLATRSRRSAVQAARAIVGAVDLGFASVCPPLDWILSALRNPDDPDRPPATIQIGDRRFHAGAVEIGSGCDPDGTPRDDTLFELWTCPICPVLRSMQTTGKANAGAFDFPEVKSDDQGRVLGQDGKALPVVETIDSETGKPVRRHLEGREVRVTDDYDESDALEHLRCQAADWADACDVAIDLIQQLIEQGGDLQTPLDGEQEANASAPPPDLNSGRSRKKSTAKGEAEDKLVAALAKHHEYVNQICTNAEPVGVRELARLAEVSPSSASRFFEEHFGRHTSYKTACAKDPSKVAHALAMLQGELTPSILFKPLKNDVPDDPEA